MLRLYFYCSAVIVYFVVSSSALECPTCLGDACDGAVPVVECKGPNHKLPFKVKTHMKPGDSPEYHCLNLEYFDNGELQQVQKCHLAPKSSNVCKDIKSSLGEYSPMVKCTVEVAKEEAFDLRAEGSGDDNDDDGAKSIQLSIFALILAVVFHLFFSS